MNHTHKKSIKQKKGGLLVLSLESYSFIVCSHFVIILAIWCYVTSMAIFLIKMTARIEEENTTLFSKFEKVRFKFDMLAIFYTSLSADATFWCCISLNDWNNKQNFNALGKCSEINSLPFVLWQHLTYSGFWKGILPSVSSQSNCKICVTRKTCRPRGVKMFFWWKRAGTNGSLT